MSGFRVEGLRRRVIRVAVRVQQERGFLKGFQKKRYYCKDSSEGFCKRYRQGLLCGSSEGCEFGG